MGRKSRLKRERLKVGEIVEVRDRLGVVPQTVCQVLEVGKDMIFAQVGDFNWGMHPSMIEVLRRGLREPQSWLPHEIKFLEHQLQRCDCDMCHQLLRAKREDLEYHCAESAIHEDSDMGAVHKGSASP